MSNSKEKDEEKPIVAKSAVDLQRLKLMKLMKNPEKPVILPDRPKAKNTPSVPEFVRNVMGSSAGAGSGEFHVYRHLRRKEYARQKFIQEKGRKEVLDVEYHQKLEENKKLAEATTAKKRAKRLKKKQKVKDRKKMKSKHHLNSISQDGNGGEEDNSDSNSESSEDEAKEESGDNQTLIECKNDCKDHANEESKQIVLENQSKNKDSESGIR